MVASVAYLGDEPCLHTAAYEKVAAAGAVLMNRSAKWLVSAQQQKRAAQNVR